MIRSDARIREQEPMTSNMDEKINTITLEVVSEIERELMESPYDMTSLVFLLYDVPDTALQRLLVYQRVSKDPYSTNMNLLCEWMLVAKAKSTWREELLEALLICQLYGIVRKLGFDVNILKRQYDPDNLHFNIYINRTKKILYKLSENIDSSNFMMLKKTLETFKFDVNEYESCELVFLKLMSEKIISLAESDKKSKFNFRLPEFNFDTFIKLIQKIAGLESFTHELWLIENQFNGVSMEQPIATSSPSLNYITDDSEAFKAQPVRGRQYIDQEFSQLYELLEDLNIDEANIKPDSQTIAEDRYLIKDPKKVGLCLIINQENFHFCAQSIEDKTLRVSLSPRMGSTLDKIALDRTMSSMNFHVIPKDNLNHLEMIDFIKTSIKEHVNATTSIFMLCILSHGVREHVYAADSIKVKVEDIKNILDSDEFLCLSGIPKVLIIQACQVNDAPQVALVADSPSSEEFRLRKVDFLEYWATSPALEAFRAPEAGSIFIQFLCRVIGQLGKHERLDDIFYQVNRVMSKYCKKKKVPQAPVFINSLLKKLYLFDV